MGGHWNISFVEKIHHFLCISKVCQLQEHRMYCADQHIFVTIQKHDVFLIKAEKEVLQKHSMNIFCLTVITSTLYFEKIETFKDL